MGPTRRDDQQDANGADTLTETVFEAHLRQGLTRLLVGVFRRKA